VVQSQESGVQTLTYSQLVLATGAQPFDVPLDLSPGTPGETVLTINSLDDYRVFHDRLGTAPKRVLLIGAGLIGCEFANDLAGAGHQVHAVDPAPGPLASLLPAEAGERLRDALGALGVTWHFGTTARSVTASENGSVCVALSDGTTVEADVIASATGLLPDTRAARAAGLRCGRGILVDANLETSAPGIFALGDAAQYSAAGDRTLPYVMPIMQAARALAMTLNGQATPVVFPVMPVAIKTPALPIVLASPAPGLAGAWEPLPDGDGFAWRYLVEGALHGFVLMGAQTAKRAALVRDFGK
jgi:rubredoxin-NAD+ reductase